MTSKQRKYLKENTMVLPVITSTFWTKIPATKQLFAKTNNFLYISKYIYLLNVISNSEYSELKENEKSHSNE